MIGTSFDALFMKQFSVEECQKRNEFDWVKNR